MKTFVQFRGAKLSYEIKGKGRALFLMHGFLGSKEIWKNYIPRLQRHYKVISVDLPGHGESECIGYLHNMELLADAIKFLLQQLNIRKTIIVGHSLGGYVGLAFAEKYPDEVLGLILINSSAKGDSKKRKHSRDQLIQLIKQDKKKALYLLIPTFFATKTRKTHWQIKRYLKMANRCSEQSIIATIEGMKIRKEREIVLKFAPFPYLFLIGQKDSILKEEEQIEQSQLNPMGNYKLFENSSHMSFYEEEEKVFKSIKQFGKNFPYLIK